ncbi:MAG: Lrp/AsnC family transcriptional regulator [Qingshengfaniella sp.]
MDSYDIAILNALQRDGAMTNAALAEVVHLSASQCSRRRTALEAAGVITGYAARLDPRKAGFGLRAITRVNLRAHGQEDAFAAFLAAQEAVLTAHSVSGDADYILDIHVRDLDAFADFIHNHLLPHPQVAQVRSEIVLKTLKDRAGLPVG